MTAIYIMLLIFGGSTCIAIILSMDHYMAQRPHSVHMVLGAVLGGVYGQFLGVLYNIGEGRLTCQMLAVYVVVALIFGAYLRKTTPQLRDPKNTRPLISSAMSWPAVMAKLGKDSILRRLK